ncbi:TNT domain-containing protein [Buchananella felis]|uniref:TNT domain-containing protein n=1 Tax=Buchananella felis TaxID=3231492 RepID=UPI003529BF36
MADAIKRCADNLRALEAGASSRAESVTALLEQRDTLLDGIGKAEGRYRAAGEALETYSAALDQVQTDTLNALYAARQATWERDEARDNQHYYQDLADDYANTDDDSGYGHDQQVRYTRLARSARQDADAAQDRIDNQVQVAQNAVRERDLAAQTAIDAIQGVTATDGLNDGWWENWGAKILGWIATIAEWVSGIAGILALVLCWVPVLGQALAVIAGIAGIVAALANIGLALGGEKTWGEALLSVVFAGLGCIGLGGLRGAVSSLKALGGLGKAVKAAGGLKGAFLTFARGSLRTIARGLRGMCKTAHTMVFHPITAFRRMVAGLRGAAQRLRIAANRKYRYVTGKNLGPGAKGSDLLASNAPYGSRFGRKIADAQQWDDLFRTGPGPYDFKWTNPAEVLGSEQVLRVDQYIDRYGDVIDRVGNFDGTWFGALDDGKVFSFEARAISTTSLDLDYHQLRLVDIPLDWTIEVSSVAPSLGYPGGATQLRIMDGDVPIRMKDLIEEGYVELWPFN